MRVSTRLLLVLFAVVAAGIGFVSPSKAVTSPVVTMVVDCSRSTPTSSSEVGLDAPAGVYIATVVGVCNWAGSRAWSVSTSTPCSTLVGPVPCATTTIANLPGDTCGTSLGAVRVEACSPPPSAVTLAPDCSFTVTVNGTCLTLGTTGQIVHPGGAFTAMFEDSGHHDNTGYFVVVLRLAV